MNAKNQIKSYLYENFVFQNSEDWLKDDMSLSDSGIIDSSGFLELVLFLEEAFGITINDKELNSSNFDSIQKITEFIQSKKEVARTSSWHGYPDNS